jgi:hypothetical protein
MAHYKRGRKALYEVMSEARLKPGFGRTLEKIREQKPPGSEPPVSAFAESTGAEEKAAAPAAVLRQQDAGAVGEPDEVMPSSGIQWRKKPRVVQFNAGRIEFSMPYQLVIAFILGLILLVLAAFRLGQISSVSKQGTSSNLPRKPQMQPPIRKAETPAREPYGSGPAVNKDVSPKTTTAAPSETAGKNVIVIVEYKARADLVPVQAHFAEYGIETEIVTEGGRYFLVTKNRYDNPNTPGTDGYAARQKIIEAGAKYKGKAPEGYETFAPNFFKDAYGKKVE